MITENLSTLKIHKLTQAQYDRELEAGNIDENALYLTPDEEIDLTQYVTVEELNGKVTEMVKLWENASTGATFAAQSIKIDTTGYKMLVIALRESTSQKHASLTVLDATPSTSHYATAIKTSTAISIVYRTVMVYSDELRIGDAYVSVGETDNTYAIPVCIYGIK